MPNPNEVPKTPNVNADHDSIAVGGISAGGDISGNIHIGNVYQTPEDDLPLSSDEIENGLTRFAQYLPERAPVLQDSFSSIAKKLRTTLGADQNSLSPALKSQREDGVNRMKLMCMEVMDISFRAICLGQNPPPYDSRPPFLGLFAFRPEDREFFFERDALVQKLVARIKAHPFLAVLGASGSGKSSLVMAGLVPALEAQMSYLTPSSALLSQLLAAKESANAKTVFVVDQFEELFTHPHDATERADFIHALLDLTKTNRVVITMRADFWGEVAIYSDLKQAMQEHQELIAPMTVDELHSAMAKQAAVVGLRFDPTLSDSILAEVKGEPGAMPLLQHALWELWNRRHGLWIKAEEYQAFGGVRQAIASTAEEVYASCSDFERARVRDIFLRLTRLDERGEGRDTRRRVLIEELIPVNSDSSVTINLLNKLADARLIVKTDKDVEVAHEALIRHWSRLTEWLNEDRDNLRLRESVSESAREWENSKRDDSLLNHRGGRLELALAMSKLPSYQLNPIEQAYLNACVSSRNKEQHERERRLRYTVITSIAAAVIFLVLGSFGLVKSNEATAQAAKAEEQAKIALARQLAAQAEVIAINNPDNDNSILRSLLVTEALNIYPSSETSQTIRKLLPRLWIPNNYKYYPDPFSFSTDGKLIASGGSGFEPVIHVWDANTGLKISTLIHTGWVRSVVFNPKGDLVVTGSENIVQVWDALSGKKIFQMTHDELVNTVAFSPDGRWIASASNDHTVRIWNAVTGNELSRIEHENIVKVIAFSPDSKLLFSGSSKGSIFDINNQTETTSVPPRGIITSTSFNSDGSQIIFGDNKGSVVVWDIQTGSIVYPMIGYTQIADVGFSPDNKQIIVGGCVSITTNQQCTKGKAEIIDLATQKTISYTFDEGQVEVVYFNPTGEIAVSGGDTGAVSIWEARTGLEIAHLSDVFGSVVMGGPYVPKNAIYISPDGKKLVSGGPVVGTNIWEIPSGHDIYASEFNSRILSLAVSPDGSQVLLGMEEKSTDREKGVATIVNIATQEEIISVRHESQIESVSFSSDGKLAASGSQDGVIQVWQSDTGELVTKIMSNENFSVVFSPDGKMIGAAGGYGNTVMIWNISTANKIAQIKVGSNANVIAFHPTKDWLAIGEGDGTLLVWDYTTNSIIYHGAMSANVNSVVFSPNGNFLVAGAGDGVIQIWDIAGGKLIASMKHDNWVSSVAFSLDGKLIISGSWDGTVRIWETTTGKELSRITHGDWIIGAVFSNDNNWVIASSLLAVYRWHWRPDELIKETCARLPRNLTRAEWEQYIGIALPYQAVCPNLPIEAAAESTPVP